MQQNGNNKQKNFNKFTEKNYCKSRPCKNGGICVNYATRHKCMCKNDYIGNNCEREYFCYYIHLFLFYL